MCATFNNSTQNISFKYIAKFIVSSNNVYQHIITVLILAISNTKINYIIVKSNKHLIIQRLYIYNEI